LIRAINLFVEEKLQLDEIYQPSLFVFYSYAFLYQNMPILYLAEHLL